MSEEHDDIAVDDGMPARKVWSTPALTAVAADEAALSPIGNGAEYSVYS